MKDLVEGEEERLLKVGVPIDEWKTESSTVSVTITSCDISKFDLDDLKGADKSDNGVGSSSTTF